MGKIRRLHPLDAVAQTAGERMKIDCVSDLHGHYPKLEGGDLLIVAGDLTARDTEREHLDVFKWLLGLSYKTIIVIAGNHDHVCRVSPEMYQGTRIHYLCDSGTEFSYFIDGFPEEDEGFLPSGKRTLKIWGSPWTKTFPGMNPRCKAFTVDTEEELAEKWKDIPDDIDILVTHGPVIHMLDRSIDGYHCGSSALREVVDRIKPRLFVFGHIHECGGQQLMYKHTGLNTWCVNASHVDERYRPVNNPVRIEL